MKKEFENIEQLFKDTFENYEANVDASVWNNIQQSINSPASSAASSSSAGNAGAFAAKSAFFKIAAATITSAVVVTSSVLIYNAFKDESVNNNKIAENQVITENSAPKNIEETATETPLTTENNTTENGSNVVTPQQNEVEDKDLTSNEKNNSSNTVNNNNTTETTTTPSNTVVENNKETQTQQSPVVTNTNTSPTEPSTTNTPKVDVLANVKLKASTKKGDAPLYVEFNVVGEAIDYQWNIDGVTKSGENVYHTFDNPGKYEVLLIVKDKQGKTKTITENIEVLSLVKSSISDIQNIFTPNGDGKNDILLIEGENIKEFKAVVYNQNGTVIFEWNTISGFWDGKDMNNQIVPDGIYFLVVNALGEDNKPYEIKKSITLRK
jgi:gliding motility-associated-like protein